MDMKQNDYPKVTEIRLSGNLSFVNIKGFGELFEKVIEKNPKNICINMEDTKYVDSSGLGMLLDKLSACRKKKISLFFVAVNPTIQMVIHLSKLDDLFTLMEKTEYIKKYL